MSAIRDILWPGVQAIIGPDAQFGGIVADKPGYHNTRDRLINQGLTNDYSIQLAIDKAGPGDEAAALDITFASAQAGNFANIARYSRLLYTAGEDKDPRAYPLREFFGNTDSDRDVEGWSFYRGWPVSSDSSHLWHIHLSIHRRYINDEAAMRSILTIFSGETPQPPTTTGVPLMAVAEPLDIPTYSAVQELAPNTVGHIVINAEKFTSVVTGSSPGIDARAAIEVDRLLPGEYVNVWWRREWKKAGAEDLNKGGDVQATIVPVPAPVKPSGHISYADDLPKADSGWTACLRLMYFTNSPTARIRRVQVRGWKIEG